MEFVKARRPVHAMMGRGREVYRTATAWRRTLTEVFLFDSSVTLI